MFKQRMIVFLAAALVFVAGSPESAAVPALLNLSKTPLFLNASVDPNVVVTFDDSGSMAQGYTPDTINDLSCYYRFRRYYSAAYNKSYYDPNISYDVPLDANGAAFPQASFTAAKLDGYGTGTGTLNLSNAYRVNISAGIGTPEITYSSSATSTTSCSGNTFAYPTGSASAFYCRYTGALPATAASLLLDTNYTCQAPTSGEQQNFANWFTYYRYRSGTLKAAISRVFGPIDDNIRVVIQNMNLSTNLIATATTIDSFAGTRRTDFFTKLFASPQSGNTPTLEAVIRAGKFFERSTGLATTNPYYDSTLNKELSCRQNFHILVTDGYWNEPSTHPTLATATLASETARTLPDTKVFSISDPNSKIIWNAVKRVNNDCTGGVKCIPNYTDLAFDYWSRDLRPTMTDNVPPYIKDRTTGVTGATVDLSGVADLRSVPEIYWNPANDPATWQHVVQYFVGFGIAGTLNFPTDYDQLRRGNKQWPAAKNNAQEAVDDSWHATIASRGATFAATDPDELVNALTDVLTSIVARKGSAAATSIASGIITGPTLTYQTLFDSSDASGTVIARAVDAGFVVSNVPTWDANCILTGGTCLSGAPSTTVGRPNWDTGRVILTARDGTGAGVGVPFRFSNLSSAQQTLLNKNPQTGTADSLGQDRLNFLRGQRTKERQNGGTLRNRTSLFGAVVNSSAVFIGAPRERYTDDNYAAFQQANLNRTPTVAVGANDGMLHILNASKDPVQGGVELWAYVPNGVYKTLTQLTNPLYTFENYVDNSPVVGDAFIGGSWKTVLVGTLRRGGQGVFALDVTSPTASEGAASTKVLWDFTDAASADLGYTYGKPFIARLQDPSAGSERWVVLVPAGYNSQEADSATGSGNSVLFVLDLATGAVIRKFDVAASGIDATSTGLSSPIVTDLDGDQKAEYAYAGDLNGNVWRFDLQSTTPASWSVSRLYKPTTPFNSPITSQPRVYRDPNSRQLYVFVGTGKFIEQGDRSASISVQSFLGLKEDFNTTTPILNTDLLTRSVVPSTGNRQVGAATGGTGKGWQILLNDLTNFPGERVIAPAALLPVGNLVVFATLIPNGDDPCIPGGRSYLMFVDAASGGPPADNIASFDTNGDGVINASDNAAVVGNLVTSLVPGLSSILQQGGGIGAILLPPNTGGGGGGGGGGSGSVKCSDPTSPQPCLPYKAFQWRRGSWRERNLHD